MTPNFNYFLFKIKKISAKRLEFDHFLNFEKTGSGPGCRKSSFSGLPGFRGFSPENPARVNVGEKNPDTGPGKVKMSSSNF